MVEPLSQEAINKAKAVFTPKEVPGLQRTKTTNSLRLDIPAYLEKYGIEVVKIKQHGSSTLYCLRNCVFDESHNSNESAIGQTADGVLFYQCFHNSCQDKTWHDARKVISGNDLMFKPTDRQTNHAPKNEPLIEVVTLREIADGDYPEDPLITGLLEKRESLIIHGQGGIGKSLLTLNIALVGASPPAEGLWGLFKIFDPFITVIVQSENGFVSLNKRLNLIFENNPELRESSNRVFTTKIGNDCRMSGDLSTTDFQNDLVGILQIVQADLLILDPLISYHGASENDNAEMRRSLDCLSLVCDRANVSCILIHHVGKSQQDNKVFSGRGAAAIGDWAADILHLEWENEEEKIIKVKHEKARNHETVPVFFLKRTSWLDLQRVEKPGSKLDEQVDIVVDILEGEFNGAVETQRLFLEKVMIALNVGRTTAQNAIKRACELKKILVNPSIGRNKTGYRLPGCGI